MHLHSVAFRAIGPFPGEHRIDVARLASSGLFLLDGPTGAGKSTIIDAIVFALYGKVASDAASDDRLRSDLAASEVESFVDLVFETQSGIYRVRRTPEYRRAKKRGTGTTTQHAGVKLWRLADVPDPDDVPETEGELLSTRLDEAGEEIRRIVGLDRLQFVQTVVLPQGEFANFLRADPEKRGQLLQKVFGTEVYDRVAARLAEMRKSAARGVEDARQGVRGAVEHFVGASGIATDGAASLREAADEARIERADPTPTSSRQDLVRGDPAGAGHDVHALAVRYVDELDTATRVLGAKELAATVAASAARERLDTARTFATGLRRRDDLRAESARLDARSAYVAEGRERLAAATRAEVVAPAVSGARAATAVLETARERQVLARTGVPGHLADADATTLEAVRADVSAAAARLGRLLGIGATLPDRERELADGRKEVARDTEEHDRIGADLAGRPAAREAMEGRLRSLTEVASQREAREDQVARARLVEAAARQVESLARDLAAESSTRHRAVERASRAVAVEGSIRAARIAGMAGELAADLADGEPCPVCGSPAHPEPAGRSADSVSADDVEAAERDRVAAESALGEAAGLVSALTERLEAARRSADGADVESARLRVAEALAQVDVSVRADEERTELTRAITTFDVETAELSAGVARLVAAIATRTAHLAGLDRTVREDRAEISREIAASGPLVDEAALPDPLAVVGSPDNPVAVLAAALADRGASIAALLDAETAVRSARRAAEERAQEALRIASDQGFGDADAAEAALLAEDERAALAREAANHDAARARVDGGLADLAELPPGANTDQAEAQVAEARTVVDEAEVIAREATRLHSFAVHTAQAARSASDGIRLAADRWWSARETAEPVTRMANLAAGTGGDNPRALSLATFVLVRRFEDVVAAANERLVEMSSGRYELAYSETREDVRSRRAGLAMKVLDHVTEQARDPRTLSGGETFYVSLCLALGLADVVAAEAGGVELGTLFVDEGFGSLDPSTLDAVLRELGRLRAGGRVVGVVSHVEALKQSIAERIEVRPIPGGGSTVEVRA